ncbi:MAG: aminoglycoside phosphotransferase family protein [Actinobacteria bacterium]|nr:aminoglycoside phosphotransferase family protein [Actinomycetota bacterium]
MVPDGRTEIARGRASVVYDLGDGTVLRRCLDAGADVAYEAEVMEHAHAHGVPTPRVFAADGTDMRMERLRGVTMLQDLAHHPEHAEQHGRTLADLHGVLDRVPAMKPADAHHHLLHLDLHPGNVMMTPSGPVLFDWTNAAPGPRELDVATTWLILACMGVDEAGATGNTTMRARLLEGFLDGIDEARVRPVLPTAGRARLADPATTAVERARLAAFVTTVSTRRAHEA